VLAALLGHATACSDWIMNDDYGLSVRTMDLKPGPEFALRTLPKVTGSSKRGYIASIGVNDTRLTLVDETDREAMVYAGLNDAGLSCDLHALLNSSYPPRSNSSNDLSLYLFCNWALAGYESAAQVRQALEANVVHLWGPAGAGAGGVHFVVRDATGAGLAVEFLEASMVLHDDLNDGETGLGVFTNEPPLPWHEANVRHYLWKQSLARPATAMPGAWYPDERFLRIFLTKGAMPAPASYQDAVQQALHVLNTITVPMGTQMGTDSGFGEGEADHTHYAHVYDHKQRVLYWRHQTNLNLQRVRLADVDLSPGAAPVTLPLWRNGLPWYNDAAKAFAERR